MFLKICGDDCDEYIFTNVLDESALFYWWEPESIFAKNIFRGSSYQVDRVTLKDWTQACERTRPTLSQQCLDFSNPNATYNQTDCDYKIVPGLLPFIWLL